MAVPAAPAPEPQERLLLVWTPGALPDGAAAAIDSLDLVESVSVVGGGVVDLVTSRHADGEPVDRLEAGWAVPLDALTVDLSTYPLVLPKSALEALGSGEVVLSETSAERPL